MRYDKSKLFKDDNGKQYLNRIEYPAIPIRDSDIFIRGVFGQTFMNLANQYYGRPELWWIIALYNKTPTESLLKRGNVILIPTPVEQLLYYL